MSSETITRLLALYCKARELNDKGHLLRSAEYFGRVAEAASALDPGPDNLVAVDMRRHQAGALRNHIETVSEGINAVDIARVLTAHGADFLALLSAVVAALERRRVAGTLLEGKCTAAEEAWFAARLQANEVPAAEASWRAPLIGYEAFLVVGTSVLGMFSNAWLFAMLCSATPFEPFARHVVHAADLMQLPRSHGTIATTADVNFVEKLAATSELGARGLDVRLVQLLTDAWQRLQRSGVLETRPGILCEMRYRTQNTSNSYADTRVAAMRAAMAAPGLRTCALAGCGAKEAHPQHFKSCAACRAVVYCCREHQVEGWLAHKKACKAARKAAAASADGGAGPGASA